MSPGPIERFALLHLLQRLERELFSGVLNLRKDHDRFSVVFNRGDILGAQSDSVKHSFITFLLRNGPLGRKETGALLEKCSKEGLRVDEYMVSSGLVPNEDMLRLKLACSEGLLVHLIQMDGLEPELKPDPGAGAGLPRLALRVDSLMCFFRAVQGIEDVNALWGWFDERKNHALQVAPEAPGMLLRFYPVFRQTSLPLVPPFEPFVVSKHVHDGDRPALLALFAVWFSGLATFMEKGTEVGSDVLQKLSPGRAPAAPVPPRESPATVRIPGQTRLSTQEIVILTEQTQDDELELSPSPVVAAPAPETLIELSEMPIDLSAPPPPPAQAAPGVPLSETVLDLSESGSHGKGPQPEERHDKVQVISGTDRIHKPELLPESVVESTKTEILHPQIQEKLTKLIKSLVNEVVESMPPHELVGEPLEPHETGGAYEPDHAAQKPPAAASDDSLPEAEISAELESTGQPPSGAGEAAASQDPMEAPSEAVSDPLPDGEQEPHDVTPETIPEIVAESAGDKNDPAFRELPSVPPVGDVQSGTDQRVEATLEATYRAFLDTDHYGIIDVKCTSPLSSIRQSYRKKKHQFSYEKYRGFMISNRASLLLQLVNKALDLAVAVILDRKQRRLYDQRKGITYVNASPQIAYSIIFDAEDLFLNGKRRMKMNHWIEAIKQFEKASEINQEEPSYFAYQAWALFQAVQNKQILDENSDAKITFLFNKALELSPNSESALLFMGRIEAIRGDTEKAIELYTRLLRGNPGITVAKDELRKLTLKHSVKPNADAKVWNKVKGMFGKK